jgi:DNA-binding response OmpR family regulator
MKKILTAEDDKEINRLICEYLSSQGYETLSALNGLDAVRIVREQRDLSLLILDLMLPFQSGDMVLQKIREFADIPVIVVSAKSETRSKIDLIRMGADDYITKPFDGKELVARVKAVLRRGQGGEEEKTTDTSFPALTVSIAEYDVHYEGKKIEMPPKELEVLYFLASHPNQVFTREQLLRQVWGFDFFGDSRTVDVHIKRLREKLPDSEKYGRSIYTVRGVGYKFSA